MFFFSYVGDKRSRAAALILDFLGYGFDFRFRARGNHDCRALVGKFQSDRAADSASASRDDRHFPGQQHSRLLIMSIISPGRIAFGSCATK